VPGVTGPPRLATLAWLVFADVNRTVGGGVASMELMRRTFQRRGWLDESTHGLFVAASRFTPGTNVLAYCACVGWSAHRVAGVAVALIAGSLPAALVVTMLSAIVARALVWPAVRLGLAAATLVAAWLVLSSAWALLRPHVRGPRLVWAVSIAVCAAAAAWVGVTPVRALLAAAVFGALVVPRQDTP
jgi:chromate transporter